MSADRHLKIATKAQAILDRAGAEYAQAATERAAAMLDAQDAGATYEDLGKATGLSVPRIAQVLRQERERRAAD